MSSTFIDGLGALGRISHRHNAVTCTLSPHYAHACSGCSTPHNGMCTTAGSDQCTMPPPRRVSQNSPWSRDHVEGSSLTKNTFESTLPPGHDMNVPVALAICMALKNPQSASPTQDTKAINEESLSTTSDTQQRPASLDNKTSPSNHSGLGCTAKLCAQLQTPSLWPSQLSTDGAPYRDLKQANDPTCHARPPCNKKAPPQSQWPAHSSQIFRSRTLPYHHGSATISMMTHC
jgi:hypothetical protein